MSAKSHCSLLAIALLAAGAWGAEHQAQPQEPSIDGAYFRMMFDHGAAYAPLDETTNSYPQMAKIGVDGNLPCYLIAEGWAAARLQYMCKVKSISTNAYINLIVNCLETNAIAFWPLYVPPLSVTNLVMGPAERAQVVESIRAYAERFKVYPHFRGFFFDEWSAAVWTYPDSLLEAFKARLLKKYTSAKLKSEGLKVLLEKNSRILPPAVTLDARPGKNIQLQPLYVKFVEAEQKKLAALPATAGTNRPPSAAPAVTPEQFRRWLLTNQTPARLELLGWWNPLHRADTKIILPPLPAGSAPAEPAAATAPSGDLLDPASGPFVVLPADYAQQPFLCMEFEYFCGEEFEALIRDMEQAVREVCPTAFNMLNFSFGTIAPTPFRSSVARVGRIVGSLSCDPYWDGAQEEGFWAKLLRAQAAGPSSLTISAGRYGTGPDRFARDLAISMVHSPAVDIWAWVYARDKPPADANTAALYHKGNHDVIVRMFDRIGKTKKFLAPSASTARMALVYSEHECQWNQKGQVWPVSYGFLANCYGLHAAFSQIGAQYEPIFEELLSEKELAPFQVVFLPGISYLRPESVKALERWVKRGGSLVVLGPAGAKDEWGRAAGAGSLDSLCGAVCITNASQSKLTMTAGRNQTIAATYNMAIPAFSYEPDSARVIGQWADGKPAAVLNAVGKGRVISLGAAGLGNCYIPWGGGTRFAVRKAFFPGSIELLDAVINMGFGETRDKLVLQSVERPAGTEVTVRQQPGRYMVHLINFIKEDAPVRGAKVTLRLPHDAAGTPIVYYPEDMSRAEFAVKDRDVTVTMRDFDVHDLVVVQFDGRVPALEKSQPGRFVLDPQSYRKSAGRSIACIESRNLRYPGRALAKDMKIDVDAYPPTLLDKPIDATEFTRRHCMLAVNWQAMSEQQRLNLIAFARQGGIIFLFTYTGGVDDRNNNYVTDATETVPRTNTLASLCGAAYNYSGSWCLNRVRFKGDHPVLKGLPRDTWVNIAPTGASAYARSQYITLCFQQTKPGDVLVEGDILNWGGPGYKLPGTPYKEAPVVMLHREGNGWVLWDPTFTSIAASGAIAGRTYPELSALARNIIEWARTQAPAGAPPGK